MKNENTTKIIDRLSHFIDYKGSNFNQLAKNIGVSNSYFSKMVKSRGSLGEDIITKILLFYEDLSVEWFVMGKGEMIKSVDIANNSADIIPETGLYKELLKEKEREIATLNQEVGGLKKELETFQQCTALSMSVLPKSPAPTTYQQPTNTPIDIAAKPKTPYKNKK